MKLKISTIFFLALFVSAGFLGFYSIESDGPNDTAPTVSDGSYTGNIQLDTTPPGGFPYPTQWNFNYSAIGGPNSGTVGAIKFGDHYILNKWNTPNIWYRYNDDGPNGGPGTLADSTTYPGAVRDLTIAPDGSGTDYLWGSNATTTLRKINATGQTISSYVLTGTTGGIRAIAWDPNRKGFWTTGFGGNIVCKDTANVDKGTITSALTGKYGLAFDSVSTPGVGIVWAWNQGTGSLTNELVGYNAVTGAIVNTYVFTLTGASVGIAGGAEIQVIDGKVMLLLNYQNQAVVGYKIADATGGGSSLCFNRTGVNVAIPDNTPAGINDTIKVPNNMGTLDDITVVVDNITHTWIGDLTLRLSHGSETDTLISRIGTGTFGNSSDDLLNVRMTDSAALPIAGIGNTINPSNGSWLPGGRSGVDSLKKHFVRAGSPANQMNGNWVLNVNDQAAGDTGRVNAWSICFYSGNITQIISNSSETPDRYTLGQNYPNPFNPTTKINFSIPKAGLVSLKVYDMLGREVSSLVNRQLNAGTFTAEFNGSSLSSGTYFYRLQVGDFVEVKKMVLLK